MNNAKLNWVRLPLEGVENCRDLGGYGTVNVGQTKWGAFLRSSDMNKLTSSDIDFLADYGVKTVIDLRGADEIDRSPNPLAEIKSFDYVNIPFAGQPILELNGLANLTMGDFYVKLLAESEYVKTIFETIGQSIDGGVVFHCSAGKDRTGILAMLLLGLAGVARKDIISNYEVSYTNLESFHGVIKDQLSAFNVPESFLFSDREYIILAYDYIIENHGDFERYLRSKGISQDVLNRVKEQLVQEIEVTVE